MDRRKFFRMLAGIAGAAVFVPRMFSKDQVPSGKYIAGVDPIWDSKGEMFIKSSDRGQIVMISTGGDEKKDIESSWYLQQEKKALQQMKEDYENEISFIWFGNPAYGETPGWHKKQIKI